MVGTIKYTDEQIYFILDQTVREIPRGETNQLYERVAKEFLQRYDVEVDFGVSQVRYVTERSVTIRLMGKFLIQLYSGRLFQLHCRPAHSLTLLLPTEITGHN